MAMFNPPHPGECLREDVLPEIKITVTALAKHLGYSRVQLSNVLNCRAGITANLAWRLELAGLGKADMWLRRQSAHDLWQAKQKNMPDITRLAQTIGTCVGSDAELLPVADGMLTQH